MRIVVDGSIYGLSPTGGIARYWTETMRAVRRMGLPLYFDVIVPPQAYVPDVASSCSRIGSLRSYSAAWRADVFHSSNYTRWPRIKCPSVVTAYDFVDASFPLLRPNGDEYVENQIKALNQAAVVIAISESTKAQVLLWTNIHPERVHVAYPAVSAPFHEPLPDPADVASFRQKITGGAPYLLHVGNRRNYKNFRTILKAFCLAARRTDRHLVIMGGVHSLSEDELDWIYSGKLADRVHIVRKPGDSDLRMAYAASEAMVHASRMEGFGIPVVEALASGTGLILSDIPVYREIANNKAVFVDPDNIDMWVDALIGPVPVDPGWRDETIGLYTWSAAAQAHYQAYLLACS